MFCTSSPPSFLIWYGSFCPGALFVIWSLDLSPEPEWVWSPTSSGLHIQHFSFMVSFKMCVKMHQEPIFELFWYASNLGLKKLKITVGRRTPRLFHPEMTCNSYTFEWLNVLSSLKNDYLYIMHVTLRYCNYLIKLVNHLKIDFQGWAMPAGGHDSFMPSGF